MKGNEKISFTGEAVAFMRASENEDNFSKYFVTDKIKRKFDFLDKFIPSIYLKKLFLKRIKLSRKLDELLLNYKPEQIIELAAGYSTRGLRMTLKNKKLVYIESDFSSVMSNKRRFFKKIESNEKIRLSKNHHLSIIDVLKDDLVKKLGKLLNKEKRTLIISETLNSYLSPEEYAHVVNQINALAEDFDEFVYLSHQGTGMLSGILGKLLLFYRDRISKTRSYVHFSNQKEIKNYFKGKGFSNIKVITDKSVSQMFYLVKK